MAAEQRAAFGPNALAGARRSAPTAIEHERRRPARSRRDHGARATPLRYPPHRSKTVPPRSARARLGARFIGGGGLRRRRRRPARTRRATPRRTATSSAASCGRVSASGLGLCGRQQCGARMISSAPATGPARAPVAEIKANGPFGNCLRRLTAARRRSVATDSIEVERPIVSEVDAFDTIASATSRGPSIARHGSAPERVAERLRARRSRPAVQPMGGVRPRPSRRRQWRSRTPPVTMRRRRGEEH